MKKKYQYKINANLMTVMSLKGDWELSGRSGSSPSSTSSSSLPSPFSMGGAPKAADGGVRRVMGRRALGRGMFLDNALLETILGVSPA